MSLLGARRSRRSTAGRGRGGQGRRPTPAGGGVGGSLLRHLGLARRQFDIDFGYPFVELDDDVRRDVQGRVGENDAVRVKQQRAIVSFVDVLKERLNLRQDLRVDNFLGAIQLIGALLDQ